MLIISEKVDILITRFVGTSYPSALRHHSPYCIIGEHSHSKITLLYLPYVYAPLFSLTRSEVYIQSTFSPKVAGTDGRPEQI
jgi:hypothetical protein